MSLGQRGLTNVYPLVAVFIMTPDGLHHGICFGGGHYDKFLDALSSNKREIHSIVLKSSFDNLLVFEYSMVVNAKDVVIRRGE